MINKVTDHYKKYKIIESVSQNAMNLMILVHESIVPLIESISIKFY